MSKGRDYKDNEEAEDIDFDFFGTPGRDKDPPNISFSHKSNGKMADKSKLTGEANDRYDKNKTQTSDSDSDSSKPVKIIYARVPGATLTKDNENENKKENKNKTSHFDSHTDSDSEGDESRNRPGSSSRIKHKRPPSGKKHSSDKNKYSDKTEDRKAAKKDYSSDEEDDRSDRKSDRLSPSPDQKHKKSKHRRRKSDSYSDSYDSDSDSYISSSSLSTSSYTESDTDSDVTHVSPLPSPHDGEKLSARKDDEEAQKEQLKMELKQHLMKGNRDTLDLKLLMQAVIDLDKEQSSRSSKKSVFVVPPSDYDYKKSQRKNYTFGDDRATEIDLENQRLMKKILKEAQAAREAKRRQKMERKQKSAVSRLTSSAVNRNKNLRKIEMENQALLKRLETAKPTKSLKRERLLKDYNSQTLFGVSVAAAHPAPKKKSSSPYASSGMGSRTHSLTSFRSDTGSIASVSTIASTKSTSRRRMKSAHSPGKNTRTVRPAWEPGW